MSLEAVVKTSGKTGLHVFVPIKRTVTFDGARQITEMVGRHLMREHPKDITMEWATPKRTGKIFMDHNMNVRGKTLSVAYSPCGSPGRPGVDAADLGRAGSGRSDSTSPLIMCRRAWKRRATGGKMRSRQNRALQTLSEVTGEQNRHSHMAAHAPSAH